MWYISNYVHIYNFCVSQVTLGVTDMAVIDMDIIRDIPHIHYFGSTLARQDLVLEL